MNCGVKMTTRRVVKSIATLCVSPQFFLRKVGARIVSEIMFGKYFIHHLSDRHMAAWPLWILSAPLHESSAAHGAQASARAVGLFHVPYEEYVTFLVFVNLVAGVLFGKIALHIRQPNAA